MRKNKMYIFDCLYGAIYLDEYVHKVLSATELQRLREVRLCNINSLSITGGANINRYEHSIGTCYLAQLCIDSWSQFELIDNKDRSNFILSGLLHDVANGAFGHSYEYVAAKHGFSPEKGFEKAIMGSTKGSFDYKMLNQEKIFFGMPRELGDRISEDDIEQISEIIRGEGRYGLLINGTLDLDNIDNVYRMAYHMGIIRSGEVPIKLAKSIWIKNGQLIIKEDAIPYVEEWYEVRRKVYKLLLLNPEEFSAKCMLTEAIDLGAKKDIDKFRWFDIDYELLQKLNNVPNTKTYVEELLFETDKDLKSLIDTGNFRVSVYNLFKDNAVNLSNGFKVRIDEEKIFVTDKTVHYIIKLTDTTSKVFKEVTKEFNLSNIVSRLMKGDLYGCIGIFTTSKIEKCSEFFDFDKRLVIENAISKKIDNMKGRFSNIMVAFHPILDKNKTKRQVFAVTEHNENITIGESSRQLLIGAFLKNDQLSLYKIDDKPQDFIDTIVNEIFRFLKVILDDEDLQALELYEEIKENAYE